MVILFDEMKKIADVVVKHYKECDLKSDLKKLTFAADSKSDSEKWLLWMTRENGTWMFTQERMWLKNSSEYIYWTFYLDVPSEHPIAYLIHVSGYDEDGNILGDIARLNYWDEANRVVRKAVPGRVKLIYEYGEFYQSLDVRVESYRYNYGELKEKGIPEPEEGHRLEWENLVGEERRAITKALS